MIVRELITKLGFSADDAAVNKHERALKNIRGVAIAAASALAAIGVAATSAAASTANAAREIDRMARLANAGTTEFQRMAAGAATMGIESDKLSDILKDMNDRVGDFAQTGGGPMLDFFEQIGPKIGVTIEDFKELSGPAALQLYVSSLQKANLSQADMVFFMEAIASDSTALLPILGENAEAFDKIADRAERYGAILSEDAIKAGKDFIRSSAGIGQILTGLKYTIGNALLPVMTKTIDKFLEWYDANEDMIRQNLGRFVKGFTRVISALWWGLNEVAGIVDTVAQSMGGWEAVMRLVVSAMGAVTAMAIIKSFRTLAGAIRKSGGAAAFMGRMMKKIPGILALMAFAAALEDIWAWVNGSKSAIGKYLGSWEDFKAKWEPVITSITDTMDAFFKALGLSDGAADGMTTLALSLGGLVALNVGMGLFGSASTAMGVGLSRLALGLTAMGSGVVAKGVAAVVAVAGSTAAVVGSVAGVALMASATATGDGTLSDDVVAADAAATELRKRRAAAVPNFIAIAGGARPGVNQLASGNPLGSGASTVGSSIGGGEPSITTITTSLHITMAEGSPATTKAFVDENVIPAVNQAIEGAARRAAANYPRAE